MARFRSTPTPDRTVTLSSHQLKLSQRRQELSPRWSLPRPSQGQLWVAGVDDLDSFDRLLIPIRGNPLANHFPQIFLVCLDHDRALIFAAQIEGVA